MKTATTDFEQSLSVVRSQLKQMKKDLEKYREIKQNQMA